jgi:hypothetical protein
VLRPLLIDVNLITAEFHKSLADAVGRVLKTSESAEVMGART